MAERKVYHVKPYPDGGWQVEFEGAGHASNNYTTKEVALAGRDTLPPSP